MQQSRGFVFLIFALVVALSSFALAGERSTFDQMSEPYEVIRQALLHDSTEGIVEASASIESVASALESNFSEEAAGVRPGATDDLQPVLATIRNAADGLGKAATIDEARDTFGLLSKAMVQYRRLVPEPGTVVAFCPMAKKVWLQPKEEIGNPYYGQSMARCGEIVSE